MPKYLVEIVETSAFKIEVEASTRRAAEAEALLLKHRHRWVLTLDERSVNCVQQLGEPWVYGPAGDDADNIYSRRPDGYSSDRYLLIFSRAHGNVFTEDEVTLLRRRVTEHVGPVVEHWNGAKYGSLSIRVMGLGKELTEEQITAIMAPKET